MKDYWLRISALGVKFDRVCTELDDAVYVLWELCRELRKESEPNLKPPNTTRQRKPKK